MKKCLFGEEEKLTQTKFHIQNSLGKLKQNQLQSFSTKSMLPRKPDEYFLPDEDDGSWYAQSQLEQQEQNI
jgi:hypothetical protein